MEIKEIKRELLKMKDKEEDLWRLL